MKTDRRELNIISLLESRGEMSINSLSQILGVSLSTLRKQLAVMLPVLYNRRRRLVSNISVITVRVVSLYNAKLLYIA